MLVVTRRLDESLQIGETVRITVLGFVGDRVRLGIEAPAEVRVLRGELLADVRAANVTAAETARRRVLKSARIRRSPKSLSEFS